MGWLSICAKSRKTSTIATDMHIQVHEDESITIKPESSGDEMVVSALLALFTKSGKMVIAPKGMQHLRWTMKGSGRVTDQSGRVERMVSAIPEE